MKLSESTRTKILDLQRKYPMKRSALIPSLHLAQNEIGYLPLDIQQEVADLFNLDPNEINAVVTFYDMFYEEPQGKAHIHVCKNISCMLRGGDELLNELCKKLNIKPGETTSDKEFTIVASECLGACDRAPMLIAGDKAMGPVKKEDIDHILHEAQHG